MTCKMQLKKPTVPRLRLAAGQLVCKNPSAGSWGLESTDADTLQHQGRGRASPEDHTSSDNLQLRLRVSEPRKDTERCLNNIFEA